MLKMSTTRTGSAMFTHSEDGMIVQWTINSGDDQPTIIAKLKKILTFMGEDPAPVYQLRTSLPETVVQTVQNSFSGIAPVQPPSLDASIQHATQNGWELIQDGDD